MKRPQTRVSKCLRSQLHASFVFVCAVQLVQHVLVRRQHTNNNRGIYIYNTVITGVIGGVLLSIDQTRIDRLNHDFSDKRYPPHTVTDSWLGRDRCGA